MNAVHGSILENLRYIKIIHEETVEVFKGDRTNTGDSKELTLNQFVESYLPYDYQVKEKSKIYSKEEETNNIDCVILSPNHPRLITPIRSVILAEGVYAAIEVKPNISTLTEKSEFYRSLKQIKSVKKIKRSTEKIEMWNLDGSERPPSYFDKIPAVIFSSKSTSLEKIIGFISKKVDGEEFDFDELPDIIVSLDKGILFYSPVLRKTDLGKKLISMGNEELPEKGFVAYKSNDKAQILVLFLRFLLNFSPPHILLSKFIVNDYLKEIETDFTIQAFGFK